MSTSTNTGGGGAGGFEKATTETTTGDAETLLQEAPLPDADGVYNVIGRIGVSKKGAADEFAAIKRFEKSFRKAGGSIQQIVDHSDSESFSDLVGGLFSSGDLTLKEGGSGLGLYGDSPALPDNPPSVLSTFDTSTLTGVPSSAADLIGIGEVDTGDFHIIFDDTSNTRISYRNPNGVIESVSSKRVDDSFGIPGIDGVLDEAKNIHVAWTDLNADIIYATNESESWVVENVTNNSDQTVFPQIDLDENGVPYISYENQSSGTCNLANRLGGSWSTESIRNSEGPAAFAVRDSTDMAFVIPDNGNTHYAAVGSPGNFSIQQIQPTFSDWGENAQAVRPIPDSSDFLGGYVGGTGELKINRFDASTNNEIASISDIADFRQLSDLNAYATPRSLGFLATDDFSNVLDISNRSGAFQNEGQLETFGANLSASYSNGAITVSDAGSGDTKLAVIEKAQSQLEDLQWNTGAEVTNADA